MVEQAEKEWILFLNIFTSVSFAVRERQEYDWWCAYNRIPKLLLHAKKLILKSETFFRKSLENGEMKQFMEHVKIGEMIFHWQRGT